jgi:hypothetical protein
MPVYIVCHKKRNNPRVDVRICELKCQLKEGCSEFAPHRNAPSEKESAEPESGSVRLEAA